MNALKQVFNSEEYAKNYDEKTRKANWLGPEILLGLAFRHINSGEKIIDLGIGTGLIAALFYKAGLQVYGMDFSAEMLGVCAQKNITVELKEHDLMQTPYPYENAVLDHAVCGGVMHIFEDVTPIFKEVSRIIRKDGIFAFACVNHDASCAKENAAATTYSHSQSTIEKLMEAYQFKLLNSIEFFVYMQGNRDRKRSFRAYVTQKA